MLGYKWRQFTETSSSLALRIRPCGLLQFRNTSEIMAQFDIWTGYQPDVRRLPQEESTTHIDVDKQCLERDSNPRSLYPSDQLPRLGHHAFIENVWLFIKNAITALLETDLHVIQ
jgi:hypothetical protein